jgi:hypothetical protein
VKRNVCASLWILIHAAAISLDRRRREKKHLRQPALNFYASSETMERAAETFEWRFA